MPATSDSSNSPHVPVHPVRFVTSTALFDGHDAAINIMRRILQAQGAEVIHLGHDRSVDEVVDASTYHAAALSGRAMAGEKVAGLTFAPAAAKCLPSDTAM